MTGEYIFISYSSKNYNVANELRLCFEKNGISVWMAPHSISSGSNYAAEIPRAIRGCKAFVLLISRDSMESIWVPKEVDMAVNSKRIIIPYMLEDCTLTDMFDFYLIGHQRYAAYQDGEAALSQIMHRLQGEFSSAAQTGREETMIVTAPSAEAAAEKAKLPAEDIPYDVEPDFIREVLENHADALLGMSGPFHPCRHEKLRKNFPLPPEEEILLAHDDTLLHSGKNGFALCSGGIYVRDLFEKANKIPWKLFFSAERIENVPGSYHVDIHLPMQSTPVHVAYVTGTENQNITYRILRDLLLKGQAHSRAKH